MPLILRPQHRHSRLQPQRTERAAAFPTRVVWRQPKETVQLFLASPVLDQPASSSQSQDHENEAEMTSNKRLEQQVAEINTAIEKLNCHIAHQNARAKIFRRQCLRAGTIIGLALGSLPVVSLALDPVPAGVKTDGDIITAQDWNDNFQYLVDAISSLETSVEEAEAQADALAVPIGTIIGWHNSIGGAPEDLPEGWMECNGQQVVDLDSPLYLSFLPDLNSEIFTDTGRGSYLRGGPESGIINASTSFGPNNPISTYAAAGGSYNGASFHRIEDADNIPDGVTYDVGNTAPTYRFQVAAMTVVWIIRVK